MNALSFCSSPKKGSSCSSCSIASLMLRWAVAMLWRTTARTFLASCQVIPLCISETSDPCGGWSRLIKVDLSILLMFDLSESSLSRCCESFQDSSMYTFVHYIPTWLWICSHTAQLWQEYWVCFALENGFACLAIQMLMNIDISFSDVRKPFKHTAYYTSLTPAYIETETVLASNRDTAHDFLASSGCLPLAAAPFAFPLLWMWINPWFMSCLLSFFSDPSAMNVYIHMYIYTYI